MSPYNTGSMPPLTIESMVNMIKMLTDKYPLQPPREELPPPFKYSMRSIDYSRDDMVDAATYHLASIQPMRPQGVVGIFSEFDRHHFNGMRIADNEHLVEPYEDWSGVRSPGRARRRLKLGHPQRIVIRYRPMKTIFEVKGVLNMHPEIRRALMAKAGITP